MLDFILLFGVVCLFAGLAGAAIAGVQEWLENK